MKTVAVLTPTYNRKHLLEELFASLCLQNNKDFEWIVIDDGSTDGTEDIIAEFKKKSDFNIRYEKKVNGGKHTALNYAYQFITAPLTFIVDSDDSLTSDAIETIMKVYEKYQSENDICGFSFLRGKLEGGYLSDSGVPEDGIKETYVECRINRGIGGDMAEVWYTDCLKEYPFPVCEGEKFLGEDVVWIRLSEKYKMRFFNRVIYLSDYLEEGLTKNRRKHNIASPNGCVIRAEAFLESNANLRTKIKAMLQYYIYGRFAKKSVSNLFEHSNRKVMFLLLLVPAHCIYHRWKRMDVYCDKM